MTGAVLCTGITPPGRNSLIFQELPGHLIVVFQILDDLIPVDCLEDKLFCRDVLFLISFFFCLSA
jgi:hypothetical protein